MERVYTDYTASGHIVVLNNAKELAQITIENIRLIFNETQYSAGLVKLPLVSTGYKDNVLSVSYDGTTEKVTITLATTVRDIVSTDKLTIKIDMGESLDSFATESNATANKNAILQKIDDIPSSFKPFAEKVGNSIIFHDVTPRQLAQLTRIIGKKVPSLEPSELYFFIVTDPNDEDRRNLKVGAYGIEFTETAFSFADGDDGLVVSKIEVDLPGEVYGWEFVGVSYFGYDDIISDGDLSWRIADLRQWLDEEIELRMAVIAKEAAATANKEAILAAMPSVSGIATEANATANKNAIIAAMPSTSGLATSSDVSSAQSSIEGKIGTPASGQPTDLFASIKSIYDRLQSTDIPFTLGGCQFLQTISVTDCAGAVINKENCIVLYSEDIETVPPLRSGFSSLKIVNFPNANLLASSGTATYTTESKVQELYAINAVSVGNYAAFAYYKKMKVCDIRKVYILMGTCYVPFLSCDNLIDLRVGANFHLAEATFLNTFLNSWTPTNALLDTTDSLLTDADRQAGFTNNKQKLLYNIREHIAGNLADLTGQTAKSIKFHANIKAAINADTATANAFSNKNWTIA